MVDGISLLKPTKAMTENDFIPRPYKVRQQEGSITWQAPSNIALVKYWGKKKGQLPANPSLSFTLEASATTTRISYSPRDTKTDEFSFEILLDSVAEPGFRPKIQIFLERVATYLPFVKEFHFTIDTSNTFPHSSGIASSASGMAALALCLADMERQSVPGMDDVFFGLKASFLARLGSGSAARSIQGPVMHWGEHSGTAGSSDLYAIPYPYELHSIFKGFRDTILLVDQGKKQVSSTLGHGLMKGHPYAAARYEQALAGLDTLKGVLASGDLEGFTAIVEQEALSLHAMMMTSRPYFILMKPNTLEIINHIWAFREASGLPVCFTLDAGANVHLLYPQEISRQVDAFIKETLVTFCENGKYICDQIGFGAKKM